MNAQVGSTEKREAPKQRREKDDKKQLVKYRRWKRKLAEEKEMKQNEFELAVVKVQKGDG